MRLTEAHIKNFKGIEDWTLKFQPGFNLIKGKNGTGKTSVLEALTVGLGAFVEWATPNDTPRFTTNNVRKQYLRSGDGSMVVQYVLPTEISLTAEFPGENQAFTWTKGQYDIPRWEGSSGKPDSNKIVTLSKNMVNDTSKKMPILCYQNVQPARMSNTGLLGDWFKSEFTSPEQKAGELKKKIDEMFVSYATSHSFIDVRGRVIGYRNALSRFADAGEILSWCNQMERVRLQKGRDIAEYEAVKQAAVSFMEAMEPGKRYRVFYDNQFSDLLCEEENGDTLSIDNLSAGYQSLIWMALDIACRMAQLNAFLLDKVTETPGVVLIDELDLHLHPQWQWRVIEALRTTFPNVQFIAATHAPILFASANDVWLIDVDAPEVHYDRSRYGLDINTAVTEYQGNYNLPERVREIADSVSEAINRKAYSEAAKLLEDLENELTPRPGVAPTETPLFAKLRTRYDIATSWPEV